MNNTKFLNAIIQDNNRSVCSITSTDKAIRLYNEGSVYVAEKNIDSSPKIVVYSKNKHFHKPYQEIENPKLFSFVHNKCSHCESEETTLHEFLPIPTKLFTVIDVINKENKYFWNLFLCDDCVIDYLFTRRKIFDDVITEFSQMYYDYFLAELEAESIILNNLTSGEKVHSVIQKMELSKLNLKKYNQKKIEKRFKRVNVVKDSLITNRNKAIITMFGGTQFIVKKAIKYISKLSPRYIPSAFFTKYYGEPINASNME